MNASPSVRVLDPLAGDDLAERDELAPEAPRKERVAPDVIGLEGLEAVARLRASGFIAAIESVPSDAADEGSVIEQEPPAGTALDREGVVTLRLAVARELPLTAPEIEPASESEPSASEDDTDRWFAELAELGRERPIEQVPARRRRKSRPTRQRADEPSAELHPGAFPAPGGAVLAHPRIVGATGLLPKAIAHFPWRRGVGVAGIVICTVVTTRVVGSDRLDPSALERRLAASGRQAALHDAAALARVTVTPPAQDAATPPVPKPRRIERPRRTATHSHRTAKGRRSAHIVSVPAPASPPPVTAPPSVAATAPATPAPAPSPQRTGSQFAYLGQ